MEQVVNEDEEVVEEVVKEVVENERQRPENVQLADSMANPTFPGFKEAITASIDEPILTFWQL